MRILILAAFLTTIAMSPAALAHHPAADIVDEEIYAMIDADLLSYLALLDGDVSLTITFTSPRALVLVIEQVEDPAAADKAAPTGDRVDFGELKLLFR